MKALLCILLSLIVSVGSSFAAGASPEPARPNFVVIFIDDMGYGDIGPFGATKQRTPNLDRMAREGMKLTSFYAAPVCSVSRAQLLTGCYGARVSVPGVYGPVSKHGLNPAEFTIAERLKERGYVTACVGKWHLGDQPEFLPTRQGFDRYFGIPYSNDMERKSVRNGERVVPLLRDDQVAELLTDEQQSRLVERYTDEAVTFIRENKQTPFFLYLPHTAVHTPIHPGKKFAGKSANGRLGDWIEEVDWSVGRVLDTLRELRLDQRTLVVFTSDNGPWAAKGADAGSAGPLRGAKGSTWEGGVRVPTLAWWPGRIAPGSVCDAVAGTIDLLPTAVALAGGSVPTGPVIDGRDLSPLLLGQTKTSPREAHYYFSGYTLQAVRQGPWKLATVVQPEGMGLATSKDADSCQPRLYNLEADISERTNVADKHPEIVAELQALADKLKAEIGGTKPTARRPAGEVADPKPLYPMEDTPRAKVRNESKSAAPPATRPNIVFIMADDLGWSDLGCYGSSYHRTPNLDRLAARGVKFTSGKASLYEGGVRVPCIVIWPGVTKPGTVNDTIIQSIDWMPTLLEMAGVPLPATAKPDGRSFVSALNGGTFDRDTIFCHFPHDTPASGQHPGTSVRRGDWKLIRLFAQNDDGSDQFELYDLKTDLGETKNLATEKPELVRELNALLDGFLKDTAAVIPKRNPDFNPAAAPASKAKAQTGVPVSPKRPNVLFILTEDQGAQMAALGTPDIATPRMDALAASGTLFRRAYVGYPVCSASKACIYTGLYPHSNGLLNNTKNHFKPAAELTAEDRANAAYKNVQIRTRNPTLVQMLKRSGYHCGITGKLHVAPNERFPYDDFIRVGEKAPLTRLAANAREKGKPWFLFYNNIGSTHRPFVDSEKQPIGLDPAKVTLPRHLPDTPTARRDWAEYLHGVQLADAALGRILDELAASGAEQDTLVVFMGDHGPAYPHGKMTPYHLGLHVPLIVRLPGVKGGRTTDALVHQIDLMPTLLDALGIAYTDWEMQGRSLRPLIEGKADAAGRDFIFSAVGGNDLRQRPTMEERSVISTRYHFIARSGIQHGRIIAADSRDWAVWRNRIYDEIIRVKAEFPEPYRILAEMDPAKLHGQPPALEFYDLQTDPHELRNLAPDPAHRAELERHHTALAQWCRETQDKAFILPPLSAVTPASASGKAKGQAGTPTKHFAPAPSSAPDPHQP
jgi:arylsulfatase A